MLIVTTNDLPGYQVTEVFGEIFGLTVVRSHPIASAIGAAFKAHAGGELKALTKHLIDSRYEAIARMVTEAEAKDANAVLAMRFSTFEMGEVWTEIVAYGTAVKVQKL